MDRVMHAPWPPDVPLAGARLLLVAPHPDDESLALGGLIQHAVQQGVKVTLLQVTDGDNNPWPQRWLERRWRIGPVDRQRWGRRRAEEARDALCHLGLTADCLHCLGWPDLGIWSHLRDAPARAVGTFAEVLRTVAPDVVVLPDLGDSHPDHGACHVIARLALAAHAGHPQCLTYLVHGKHAVATEPVTVMLDPFQLEAKRQAVLAHRTQVALARRRLLRMVAPVERLYHLRLPERSSPANLPAVIALPWSAPRRLQRSLQLSVMHAGGVHVWPWRHAPLQHDHHAWQLVVPKEVCRGPVFARLELRCPSPWIFDHWGWCDLTAAACASQADA